MLLALMGGVAGIGIAEAGLRFLVAIGRANLPRLHEISLDAHSIAFTLAISLVSAALFGTIAALKSMRPAASLAHASAGRTASTSREGQRGRNRLVIAQVAMAMVLLISAVLMIRTLAALCGEDPGFADANHVQTLRIAIPKQLIPDAQMTTRVEDNIAGRLAAIPGVDSVGFARNRAHGRDSTRPGTTSSSRARTNAREVRRCACSTTSRLDTFTARERAWLPVATTRGTTSTGCGRWESSQRTWRGSPGVRRKRPLPVIFLDATIDQRQLNSAMDWTI